MGVEHYNSAISALCECVTKLTIVGDYSRLRSTRSINSLGRISCLFMVIYTDFMIPPGETPIVSLLWERKSRFEGGRLLYHKNKLR